MQYLRRAAYFIVWALCMASVHSLSAQVHVGLDNYFNQETNAKGQPYHYLWTDEAASGFSRWGKIFQQQGAVLQTLHEAPNAANLKKLGIYIIVDPDTTTENPHPHYISTADIHAIMRWVKAGGVLVLLANDAGNCEFTHLNLLAANFGMYFNPVSFNKVTGENWEMGAITPLPDHPVFKDVSKIYMKEVSTFALSAPAISVVEKEGNILMAESHVGKGFVFAVGDPWIYNEYIDHDHLPASFQNHEAAVNLSNYLIAQAKKDH